jgi:multiple sugar transport system substrate-binding protein
MIFMGKMKGARVTLALIVIIAFVLSGCSKNESVGAGKDDNKVPTAEPVELSFYLGVSLSDSDYKTFIIDPIKKKFPNITLNRIDKPGTNQTNYDELVAAGQVPDIIFSSFAPLPQMVDLKMLEDLTPYFKKQNINLGGFEPQVVHDIQDYTPNGGLLAIPLYLNFGALFYNKDIFDKFGVPYPKDGMTWNQTIELARKVTRNDGGVQYRGLDAQNHTQIGDAYSLPSYDSKAKKATINTDGWKKVMTMIKDIYDIPGNLEMDKKRFAGGKDLFFTEKNIAMYSIFFNGMITTFIDLAEKGQPMNWDMTTPPNFDDRLGVGSKADAHMLLMSATSKHKDQAFQVISYLTSSQEAQTLISRNARMSGLTDSQIREVFGADVPALKGKNIANVLKVKPAVTVAPTIYDPIVTMHLKTAKENIVFNHSDVNTALREAQEAADQEIQAEMAK